MRAQRPDDSTSGELVSHGLLLRNGAAAPPTSPSAARRPTRRRASTNLRAVSRCRVRRRGVSTCPVCGRIVSLVTRSLLLMMALRRRPRLLFLISLVVLSACDAMAADVDTGGFTQDGKTTYCQGVSSSAGPLVFEMLEPSSTGKCPIDVQLSLSTTRIKPKMPLNVSWSAAVHLGPVPGNLFPRAIDPASNKPQNVIASLLRACRAGSNCKETIEPALLPGGNVPDAGPFDDKGGKSLPPFVFWFPESDKEVEYIITGKVVLPGDPVLNISATEFVAFQTVRVNVRDDKPGDGSGSGSVGIVKPGDANVESVDTTKILQSIPTPQQRGTTTTAPPATSTNTTAEDSGSSSMVIIGSIIGAVVVLVAIAMFAIVRKRHSANNNIKKNDRKSLSLSDLDVDTAAAIPPRTSAATSDKVFIPPKPVYRTESSGTQSSHPPSATASMSRPPSWSQIPVYEQHDSEQPSSDRYSSDSEMSIQPNSVPDSQEDPNAMVAVSHRSSIAVLEDRAMSEVSSLGSIHDSSEDPLSVVEAVVAAEASLASSSSSLMSSTRSYSYFSTSQQRRTESAIFRPSSRLFTEANVNPLTQSQQSQGGRSTLGSVAYFARDTSEYHAPFETRGSESTDWTRPSSLDGVQFKL